MTKEEFLKSNYFKIGFPVMGFALLITLWKKGVILGQYLYAFFN
jgi:hypothetical protein